jgi:hypothetical protein
MTSFQVQPNMILCAPVTNGDISVTNGDMSISVTNCNVSVTDYDISVINDDISLTNVSYVLVITENIFIGQCPTLFIQIIH